MRKLLACLVCTVGIIVLVQGADWTTHSGDNRRTAWQRDDARLTRVTLKNLQLLWKVRLDVKQRSVYSLFGPLIEAGRSHAADLEEQHTALRQHVSTIETARENLSERVSHLESERDTLARHAADLEERGALLEQQTSDLTQQVSHLTRQASHLGQDVTTLSDQVSNLEQRNAQTTHELASAKHHVAALLQSASWRITGPLRAAARVFMGRPKGR